ncbi:hypothetical protein AEAC466_04645 [Asticcacaulis sp. AC466]|uniref:restriction endonuclease subunit S n=1 Tax=Asticcacaulis sp. AC466 TaxID=1282362 RepID=UPI0003C40272|nr:restriction endonuclease subunit S [Asticcacaulis sp. AC466]ESQ85333.1 hypothetical protein AEAC466_04645 [Asticcacaulis sp. AC466]
MSDLPKGWTQVAFSDVVEVNPRRSFDLEPDDAVTFVPMAAVNEITGVIIGGVSRPLREVVKGFTQFADGDVIFAKITPSMENGKAAIARDLKNSIGFGSTEFHVLRSYGGVLPEYIWYFIRQASFRENARKVMTGAVGQQRVPATYLEAHSLPLPPRTEQRRIVAKLGGLISRTTCARDALDHIPTLIEKYKTRILDMAFSGELTKDLRPAPPGNEAVPKKLPKGWEIKLLGNISEIQGGIQVGKKRKAIVDLESVAYLRVANVQRGWLNLDEIKTIEVTSSEKERLLLREGDILMNEGGDRDKLGRGWIWEGQISDCIHQNHVFRIRLKDASFPPKFVSHYANEKGQRYFFDQGTQTTNLASVSKRKISALPVPVPPRDEAVEIVRRIEIAFAWLDRVSDEHAAVSRQLPLLDSSILQSAFRGELVPQNPHDEPASSMLERIEAEKEAKQIREKTARKIVSRSKKPTKKGATMADLIEVLKSKAGWVSASNAAQALGIGDGATSDAVEAFYNELRMHLQNGDIEVERRGNEDWLRLMPISEE